MVEQINRFTLYYFLKWTHQTTCDNKINKNCQLNMVDVPMKLTKYHQNNEFNFTE